MRFTTSLFLFVFTFLFVVVNSAHAQINFGKPKEQPPLPNPYTINLPRADVSKAVQEILQSCTIEIDTEKTNVTKGNFVTKSWVFTKGLNTRTDLEYVSNLPAGESRNWLKGRYALEINVLPLDEKRSQLQVIARIQGQMADVVGSKWVESTSNGRVEEEAIRAIAGKILGLDLNPKPNMKRRLMGCEF